MAEKTKTYRIAGTPNPKYHTQQGKTWRDSRTHRERKEAIYNAIVEYLDKYGYSPSMREIAERCSILSISTIRVITLELEIEGRLERTGAPMRSIVPTGR